MSVEAVGRLGALLTACARCGVVRAEHGEAARIGHTYEGLSQREAMRMVEEEAVNQWA